MQELQSGPDRMGKADVKCKKLMFRQKICDLQSLKVSKKKKKKQYACLLELGDLNQRGFSQFSQDSESYWSFLLQV